MVHHRRRALLAVGVLSLTLVASGCGAILGEAFGPADAQRDEPGGEITAASDADVFSLQVGDCFSAADTATSEVSEVPVVPCDEPHDAEIYAETTLPAGDFPGDDEVLRLADEYCLAAYEAFVGVAADESEHVAWPFTPTQDGWEVQGDRVVQCVVDTMGTEITGSLAGTAS